MASCTWSSASPKSRAMSPSFANAPGVSPRASASMGPAFWRNAASCDSLREVEVGMRRGQKVRNQESELFSQVRFESGELILPGRRFDLREEELELLPDF